MAHDQDSGFLYVVVLFDVSIRLLPLLLTESFPEVSRFRFLREESDWPNSSVLLSSQVIDGWQTHGLAVFASDVLLSYAHLAEAVGRVGNESKMAAVSFLSILEGIFALYLQPLMFSSALLRYNWHITLILLPFRPVPFFPKFSFFQHRRRILILNNWVPDDLWCRFIIILYVLEGGKTCRSISKHLLCINRNYYVPRLLLEYPQFNFLKSSKQEIHVSLSNVNTWKVQKNGLCSAKACKLGTVNRP